jgi:hypothetical protein
MNLGETLQYLQLLKMPISTYNKLNPKISVNTDEKTGMIHVLLSIDREKAEISKEINTILENIKPLKLSNMVFELKLRDQTLRLTCNGN